MSYPSTHVFSFIVKYLKRRDFWITLVFGILIGFICTRQPNAKYVADINDYEDLDMAVEEIQNEYRLDNNSLAGKLFEKVRVLCWVIIAPWSHHSKARHVKNTWGQRCNRIIFFSSIKDKELDTVVLPIEEGYRYLWGKTKSAVTYLYAEHLTDADWFLKADDDTYVVLENLRLLLSSYSSNESLIFGSELNEHENENEKYLNGGAGYVLSRRALKKLVTEGFTSKYNCRQTQRGSEDVEIAKCLKQLNVPIANSLDYRYRQTFMPFSLNSHLVPGNMDHDWSRRFVSNYEGLKCCSDFSISFHSLTPNEMYVYHFFIYRMKVYGIDSIKENTHIFEKGTKLMPKRKKKL